MVTRRTALVAVAALALGGCTASPAASQLPDAGRLATSSAASLAKLGSVRFAYSSNGKAGVVDLETAEGVAVRDGRTRGTADVVQRGEHTKVDFVLDDGRVRLTGSDGADTPGTELSLPETFLPDRLLSGDGIGGLLTRAEKLRTETREELDDTPAYRLTGTLPRSVLTTVLPGVRPSFDGSDDIDVKFWVGTNARHDLLRVWLQLPPSTKNEGSVVVELSLSEHDRAGQSR